MDENMNTAVENEGTTPQTETVEGAAPAADPTPAETPATEQPTGTTPEAEGGAEDPQPPVEPFLPVQFDHETINQTREEAIENSQLGLLYKKLKPMLDDLALLGAAQGKSTAEFVRWLKQEEEKAMREDKLRITGGNADAAEILVQAELDQRSEALRLRERQKQEAAEAEEKSTLDRLAGELVELRELVPELTDWDAIPQAVKEDAIKNNRNLTDAYLRYMHREGKNIEQNRAAQAAAAAASVGSQADKPPAGVDPAIEAMRRAIRNA